MAARALKVKAAAATVRVAQSREEANDMIAAIGRAQRERDRLQARMNDVLERVKARYEGQARPHLDDIIALKQGVQIWCEANRDALTEGGKTKTARLAAGEIRWRMTPPKVVLRNIENLLSRLYLFGFDRFIRTKREIDKEAILKEPEVAKGIAGISIVQTEEFVIVPSATELEEVA